MVGIWRVRWQDFAFVWISIPQLWHSAFYQYLYWALCHLTHSPFYHHPCPCASWVRDHILNFFKSTSPSTACPQQTQKNAANQNQPEFVFKFKSSESHFPRHRVCPLEASKRWYCRQKGLQAGDSWLETDFKYASSSQLKQHHSLFSLSPLLRLSSLLIWGNQKNSVFLVRNSIIGLCGINVLA